MIKIQINTRSEWGSVIGPVKIGFNALLKISEAGNNYGQLRINTQILVSKNGCPFALKGINASEGTRTLLNLIIQ